MLRSIRRVGLVCAIILVPIVLVSIAMYPRIATGAAEVGHGAAVAEQAQSVAGPAEAAVPPGSTAPDSSGLAPASGVGPPPPPVNGVPGYMWNYSAKFVCGVQEIVDGQGKPIVGEPPVKIGNYATEINIHNYNYKPFVVRKKVVLVVEQGNVIGREPQAQPPSVIINADIGPDFAMMDDCNQIWTMLYTQTTPIPTPMPLMIGYLVIISPLDLDINTVYTAAEPGHPNSGTVGGGITAIAIDVLTVVGKRVFVPR